MPVDLLNAAKELRTNDQPTMNSQAAVPQFVSNGGFMDQFLMEAETIRKRINDISNTITLIKSKQVALLSTPSPDPKIQSELDELNSDIKRIASQLRTKLTAIEASIREKQTHDPTSTEIRILTTQHAALSRQLLGVLNEYNVNQIEYRDKTKSRYKTQLEIAKFNMSEAEVEQMLESGNPQIFTQGILADTQQAKQNLADIEARHLSILKLEKSIQEVSDLFFGLGSLIEAQGTMVDKISYNVNQANEYTEEAKLQTSQAVVYTKSLRKKKIWMAGIFIGILAVVVIIILVTVVPKG